MKVSIILPTLFPDLARRAIDDWRKQLAGIEHEFVVVCPHEVGGDCVRWVPEDKPSGSSAAAQLGFENSTGDVLIGTADDHRFGPTAVQDALTAFSDPNRIFPLVLAYPHRRGAIDFVWTYFGRLGTTFTAIGRADVERAGGYSDRAYRIAFSDSDLGMRVWRAGGQVRHARSFVQSVNDRLGNGEAPTKTVEMFDKDFVTFHARWASHFDPAWGDMNINISLEISAEFLPLLSPDPGTLALDGPTAMRDLLIARSMSVAAYTHNAPMPRNVAAAGLAYLRWVSQLDDFPVQAYVNRWYWADIVAPSSTLVDALRGADLPEF